VTESRESPPHPGVELEVTWGVTDGSAPESVRVSWTPDTAPDPEGLIAILRAMGELGIRYDFALAPPPADAPKPNPLDLCHRPSCGHPRQHHDRSFGPCNFCAESVVCPRFRELAPLVSLHPSEVDE
jgi:hypothetical protein